MRLLAEEFSTTFSDWILPAAIVVVTWAAVRVTRLLLARLHGKPGFRFIHSLAPALASLVYLVGLRGFADTAPLGPKISLWLESGVYVTGVLIVLNLLQRAALLAIEWSSLKSDPSTTLHQGFIPLIRNLVTLFVFSMGGIMILKHFSYDVMSLITALGVGSLAVGLAAKDTLSNMISGFILVIDRNLKAGDRINLSGQVGHVDEIGLRSTRIVIGNGSTLIVPNSELVNTKILNLSMPSKGQACTVNVRVPLQVSFEEFRLKCQEVLSELPQLDRSRGTAILLSAIVDVFFSVNVNFWIEDSLQEGLAVSNFNENLLARLRKDGVSLLPPPALVMQQLQIQK